MSEPRRRFLSLFRTLHIYLSMLGLVLMLFFSVTGFVLNHEEYFGLDDPTSQSIEATLPAEMLVGPDKLAIAETLRAQHGARGLVSSFDMQDDELRVVFKAPGRSTEATIQRPAGQTQIIHESHGVLGRLADLHRGAYAPPAARRLIDAMAILLASSALTGLILWTSLPKRRTLGLLALLTSLLVCGLVYIVLVPG